jgi:sugar lactone lactonase YvrE
MKQSTTLIQSIHNPICLLAECPIWNDTENRLYWTDILAKRIWKYDPQSGTVEVEWEGDLMVGGFAFTASNDLVLCTHKGVYLLSRQALRRQRGPGLRLLFDIPMAHDERFNDITTDPRGRIFAGTLTERREAGILYRLQRGKLPVVVLRDIGTSNGMTFSPDLQYFYHTNSHARTITRYDYDAETGNIKKPSIIYRGREENGVPDGITMDTEGYIWVACWRGGKVVRIGPQGKINRELPVPAMQPSSVAFGGQGMKELYITSACEGGSDLARGLDEQGKYLGGEVFHVSLDVAGRKEWCADF